MQKRLHILLITALALALAPCGFAQNTQSTSKVGTTAAQFLKIGVGARPIALGGAYVAVDEGIESIYWNPASIARIAGAGEATFNHANWLVETNYDFAAFSLNMGTLGTLGVHFISFRVPEEKVRTIEFPDGTGQVWDYNSMALGVTLARNLTDRFSIGVTAKFIQEKLFNETAQAGAIDLGVFYHTPWPRLKLGASITNFGTKMRLRGRDTFINVAPVPSDGAVNEVPAEYRLDSFDIPLGLRFGISYLAANTEDLKLMLLADGAHPNDNKEYLNLGAEVALRNIIFLRGGYNTLFQEDSERGLTLGAGLRYDAVGTNLRLDFGWADYGRLDSVKFVTITVGY